MRGGFSVPSNIGNKIKTCNNLRVEIPQDRLFFVYAGSPHRFRDRRRTGMSNALRDSQISPEDRKNRCGWLLLPTAPLWETRQGGLFMPNDASGDFLRRLINGDPSLGILADAPVQHRKRVSTAFMMEQESAQEVGMLGYQSRLLVQCSLPYRQLPATHGSDEWRRAIRDCGGSGVRLAIWAVPAADLTVDRDGSGAKAEPPH